MANQPTPESFLKDVEQHRLTILKDGGLYRHLRLARPTTMNMHFDIVTWPGYLAYTGDMGNYVFTRVEDMLKFFRSEQGKLDDISPSYWAEKCVARDQDGITVYSPEKFKQVINEWIEEIQQEYTEQTDFEISAVVRKIKQEVLSAGEDGEFQARQAVENFESNGVRYYDFWEINLHDYTYRFIWCCYALVWGIKQYDDVTKY